MAIHQALGLLRQSFENTAGDLVPRIKGGAVDLGCYHDFVHGHDGQGRVTLGLQLHCETSELYGWDSWPIGAADDTCFIFTMDHPTASKETCNLRRIPLIVGWSGVIEPGFESRQSPR